MTPAQILADISPPNMGETKLGVHIPLGLVSPLWLVFAGATTAGMAYWWMTRFAKPANLEAMFALAPPAMPALPDLAEPMTTPAAAASLVVEAADAVTEATTEAVEALLAPAAEAEANAEATVEAVAEEIIAAAPEPVVEAPPPKARPARATKPAAGDEL